MGGRGSKSGINSGALNKTAKEQVIETYYRKNSRYGSHYGKEVLGAKEGKNGEITLSTENARFFRPSFSLMLTVFLSLVFIKLMGLRL